jgi:hypothetical protein
MEVMKTFEATICEGTKQGRTIILGDRRAWLAVGAGAVQQTYRLT